MKLSDSLVPGPSVAINATFAVLSQAQRLLLMDVLVLSFEPAILKPFLPRVCGSLAGKLNCQPLRAAESCVEVIAMIAGCYTATDQLKRIDDLLAFDLIVKVNRSRLG